MLRLCAQGDLLIERVEDAPVSGVALGSAEADTVVVSEGEFTGHHHKLFGRVTFYRDDALARDIPDDLYVGHVQVTGAVARLEHEEHAAVNLEQGTYRVRRQRQLEPADVGIAGD
jgi:hypothetical protein